MLLQLMTMLERVLLTFALLSYVVHATVLETTENYICGKESQNLQSEIASRATDCEQNWIAESTTIASYISGNVECHHPCINMTAGKMIISDCINVTLAVICFLGHVTEYRINFCGIQNNPSPLQVFKQRGHFGIWTSSSFLLLIIVGFTIQYFMCQSERQRNTRSIQH